jgi:serine/threonine protein kinase
MPLQPLDPGFRLGKYEVLAHIATGGMGTVYKAMDLELHRLVALKVLDPALAARDVVRERFKREARHAARLSHKHIVTIYEAKADQGFHYIAMEFVQGIDLGECIQRKGRLGAEETRRILIQAAKALDHAFQQGVVHRDIKPSNFLLAQEGRKIVVKLTDMGLARTESEDEFRVTRAGSTVGTIDYMAPEQARDSASADTRSDMYSLGCTAYHMLTGRPPFAEGGLGERLYKHLEAPPPDLRQLRPDVSVGLWYVLQRMLAKKPSDRYQTPAELLAALKATAGDASRESASETLGLMNAAPVPSAKTPSSSSDLPSEPFEEAPTRIETPAAAPEPPEPRRKRRPAAVVREPSPPPEETAPVGAANLEQARAAAGQYERARQVIAEGGDADYARQLLLSCCKLDPSSTAYRKTLRQLEQGASKSLLGRWLGSLNVMALKARLRAAKRGGDHRKVLEQGEEVLARQPGDAATHLDMAESAEALGYDTLAVWLVEQGRDHAPDHIGLMRALARLYEKVQQLNKAIATWELVRKAQPDDFEIQKKINALSVRDHISKGSYRR